MLESFFFNNFARHKRRLYAIDLGISKKITIFAHALAYANTL